MRRHYRNSPAVKPVTLVWSFKEVLAGQIEAVIAQRGGKILENYQLFDIYEGSQIKEGYKSMAYSVTFRAKDRTLEDADVNAAMKKILNGLETLGIELRK